MLCFGRIRQVGGGTSSFWLYRCGLVDSIQETSMLNNTDERYDNHWGLQIGQGVLSLVSLWTGVELAFTYFGGK
jgi:hypothetical protein